jgi:hypothetical protein
MIKVTTNYEFICWVIRNKVENPFFELISFFDTEFIEAREVCIDYYVFESLMKGLNHLNFAIKLKYCIGN